MKFLFSGYYLVVLCSKLHLQLQNVLRVALTLQSSDLWLYKCSVVYQYAYSDTYLGLSSAEEEVCCQSIQASVSVVRRRFCLCQSQPHILSALHS